MTRDAHGVSPLLPHERIQSCSCTFSMHQHNFILPGVVEVTPTTFTVIYSDKSAHGSVIVRRADEPASFVASGVGASPAKLPSKLPPEIGSRRCEYLCGRSKGRYPGSTLMHVGDSLLLGGVMLTLREITHSSSHAIRLYRHPFSEALRGGPDAGATLPRQATEQAADAMREAAA